MEDKAIQHRCYRQAGHATMYYLLKQGFVTKYTPVDRSMMLPTVYTVSIEEQNQHWGGFTGSLGSLIVTSQVMLAGDIAENIQFPTGSLDSLLNYKILEAVEHYIASYLGEYNPDIHVFEREKDARQFRKELSKHVEGSLREHWALVQKLAEKLEKDKTILMKDVIELLSH